MKTIDNVKCKSCGKILDGVITEYGGDWFCKKCSAYYGENILFCERGDKVRASHIDSGTDYDLENANKFLENGKVYVIKNIIIGGYISHVELKEIPGKNFNTVHFTKA